MHVVGGWLEMKNGEDWGGGRPLRRIWKMGVLVEDSVWAAGAVGPVFFSVWWNRSIRAAGCAFPLWVTVSSKEVTMTLRSSDALKFKLYRRLIKTPSVLLLLLLLLFKIPCYHLGLFFFSCGFWLRITLLIFWKHAYFTVASGREDPVKQY